MQLKVLQPSTLRSLVEDMNAHQAVATALMPRFAFEVIANGGEFTVSIAELQTGHPLQMARDVANGLREALEHLVARIDEVLAEHPEA